MKRVIKSIFYLSLLLLPFLIMVAVNESQRGKLPDIHSTLPDPTHCNWYCHNHTDYCIKTHNSLIRGNLYIFTNKIYNTILAFLGSIKGGYKVMNILFLVIIFPLAMWFLAIGFFEKLRKIKSCKS